MSKLLRILWRVIVVVIILLLAFVVFFKCNHGVGGMAGHGPALTSVSPSTVIKGQNTAMKLYGDTLAGPGSITFTPSNANNQPVVISCKSASIDEIDFTEPSGLVADTYTVSVMISGSSTVLSQQLTVTNSTAN